MKNILKTEFINKKLFSNEFFFKFENEIFIGLFVYCLWDSEAEWSQNTMIQVKTKIRKW